MQCVMHFRRALISNVRMSNNNTNTQFNIQVDREDKREEGKQYIYPTWNNNNRIEKIKRKAS